MCGFIAQLVEHRTGVAEVTGSNPVEALIFFRLLLSNCLNWKIYCDDHISLSTSILHVSKCIKHGSIIIYLLTVLRTVIWIYLVKNSPPKKLTCPQGKWRAESSSPTGESTNLQLLKWTFFAHCTKMTTGDISFVFICYETFFPSIEQIDILINTSNWSK